MLVDRLSIAQNSDLQTEDGWSTRGDDFSQNGNKNQEKRLTTDENSRADCNKSLDGRVVDIISFRTL